MSNLENLDCILKQNGFVLVGVPELNRGKHEYALFDERNLITHRVKISDISKLVELCDGYANTHLYIDHPSFPKELESFLSRLDAGTEQPEKDLEVGRLIKEVKTVRLRPDDRLLVSLKEESLPENLQDRRNALNSFRESLLNWIGEKSNPGRVMIVIGDIDLQKVRKEDA